MMFQSQDAECVSVKVAQPTLRRPKKVVQEEEKERLKRVEYYERQVTQHTHGGEVDNPYEQLTYKTKRHLSLKEVVPQVSRLRRKVFRKVSHCTIYDTSNGHIYRWFKTTDEALNFVDRYEDSYYGMIATLQEKRGISLDRFDLCRQWGIAEHGEDGQIRLVL
jgi:hypothetical protein